MGVASGGDGIDLSLEGHPDCVEMKGEGERFVAQCRLSPYMFLSYQLTKILRGLDEIPRSLA